MSSYFLQESIRVDAFPQHGRVGGPTTANQQASVSVSLLLVASQHHLATRDLRRLTVFLRDQNHELDIRLQLIDPGQNPELLELHKLVAMPALVKLSPAPRQVFTGITMLNQVRSWLPRWGQMERLNRLAMPVIPSPVEDGRDSPRALELEDQLLVLRQENEALIDRLQFQERQLRMVAHDLRTPMTTTSLALQSFKRGHIGNEELLDILGRRLHEMEQLSNDLLEVGSTRWEALFNPQRLSLSQVCADVLLELEKMWSGRNLEIQTDIPSDLPDVFADSRRMRQVLPQPVGKRLQVHPGRGPRKAGSHASHQPMGAGEHLRQRPRDPGGGAGAHLPGSGAPVPNLLENRGVWRGSFRLPPGCRSPHRQDLGGVGAWGRILLLFHGSGLAQPETAWPLACPDLAEPVIRGKRRGQVDPLPPQAYDSGLPKALAPIV